MCFTPGGDCTGVIVREIGAAKKSVRVQAYSFTSAPIAKALVDASKRGVHVEVILDRSNRTERYSGLTFLVHADVPTSVDSKHAIAHNKVIVIDDETVITGSFNFTKAAQEHNASEPHPRDSRPSAGGEIRGAVVIHLAHSDDVTP